MWASDTIERILQLLVSQAESSASINEVGMALGIDPSQASRFLKGTTKADLSRILRVLELLDISAPVFFKIALKDHPQGPAEVLRYFREDPKAELCDFLRRYDSLIRILEPSSEPAGPSTSRRKLLRLEDLRFVDPLAAREKLEKLAGSWLTFAESAQPSRTMLGDIATALAIWASVMRLRNHRDDAVAAMVLALRLGKLCGDPWVMGLLYQKAAYLLMDLGATEEGIELLDQALKWFTRAKAQEWRAKVYTDYGVLYHHMGRSEEAIAWLELAIEELPKSLRRYRFSAYHTQAIALAAVGRPADAAEALAMAIGLQPDDRRAEAVLNGAKADLQLEAGELASAVQSYHAARVIFMELEQWSDAAILTVDLAKVLLRTGDRKNLAELSGEITFLAKKLRRHKATEEMLLGLALGCRRGSVKEPQLRELAKKLRATFPKRRAQLDQN